MSFDYSRGKSGGAAHCHRQTFKLLDAILFDEAVQPWEAFTEGYTATPPIPSMMCSQELQFLHYLARMQFDGEAAIVDLGPLAGSSTYALASGAAAVGGSRGRVFSYDLWEFFAGCEQFVENAGLRIGDDILPSFLANVDRFRDHITVRKGDIARQRWKNGPIAILFIDAAKSPRVMRHIADEFFPHLVPGAFVVQQDWVSAEDPWIHIAMGSLAGHFEIMDSPEGGTVCFRVKSRIPKKVLPANFLHDPDAPRYFASARSVLPDWHGLCVSLAEAHHRVLIGDTSAARRIVTEVQQHSRYNPGQVGYDIALVERAIAGRERGPASRLNSEITKRIRRVIGQG